LSVPWYGVSRRSASDSRFGCSALSPGIIYYPERFLHDAGFGESCFKLKRALDRFSGGVFKNQTGFGIRFSVGVYGILNFENTLMFCICYPQKGNGVACG
jgi:hypothetical protein